MNEIQNFDFKNSNVRVIEKDGEPYFVGKDVAEVLGYARPSKAIQDHCKAKADVLIWDGSQNRNMVIIPERDVYRLIMRSKKPEAEKFEDWVVSEVLPSIRKTGSYDVTNKLNDPVEMARLLQKQVGLYLEAVEELKEAKPKVEAYDTWLECDGDYSTVEAAKMLGTTSVTLNKFLRANGIKMKHNDLPTAKFKKWFNVVEEVYTDNKGNARKRKKCMVTPEGLVEIKNRMP